MTTATDEQGFSYFEKPSEKQSFDYSILHESSELEKSNLISIDVTVTKTREIGIQTNEKETSTNEHVTIKTDEQSKSHLETTIVQITSIPKDQSSQNTGKIELQTETKEFIRETSTKELKTHEIESELTSDMISTGINDKNIDQRKLNGGQIAGIVIGIIIFIILIIILVYFLVMKKDAYSSSSLSFGDEDEEQETVVDMSSANVTQSVDKLAVTDDQFEANDDQGSDVDYHSYDELGFPNI